MKRKYLFPHEVDLYKPKKIVEDVIFHHQYDGLLDGIEFGELPPDLQATDRIEIHKNVRFYSENEGWEDHTIVEVMRPRLETDEEQKERLEKSQEFRDALKQRRYETYLKLKEEFDVDKDPAKPEPKPESEELLPCPNCGTTNLKDCYIYIRCDNYDCLMTGPKANGGTNNDHVDYMDHKWAIKKWNELPRKS
jgi:hypothetical protein